MGQRLRRQFEAVHPQALDHFIAQVHAGEGVGLEAMRLHPVAHIPAAHAADLGRQGAVVDFPEIQGRNAVDGSVHRIVQHIAGRIALRELGAERQLAGFEFLIGDTDHGDAVAVGIDQGRVDAVELGMADRQQDIRSDDGIGRDLRELADHPLQVDAQLVADPAERGKPAGTGVFAHPPEMPGDECHQRGQEAEATCQEGVELCFAHSEIPRCRPEQAMYAPVQ